MNSLTKNTKLFLIFGILFLTNLFAAAQIRHANALFNQFKYSKAIPLYKKASENKEIKIRQEATVRLADCYRLMANMNEAREWYTKAISFTQTDAINYYYLGRTLRTLGSYDEAEVYFLKYAEKAPNDSKGKVYASYCHDIKKWDSLPPSAEIKNEMALNTPYSAFGPTFYKDRLVFTSDRDVDVIADKNYLWTSFGYLDLYESFPGSYNDFWSDMKPPVKLSAGFNHTYHDGPASFTGDFSKIFTTRTLKNSSKKSSSGMKTDYLKIFIGDLPGAKKIKYVPFPYNGENYSVGHPSVSKDGKMLIFSSNKPGGFGESDLYISELKDGKWSEPKNLGPEVNTFGKEVFPFWANDSTLFFSSDGLPGYGGLDIYETTKINGHWTKPYNLKKPLNSSFDDFSIVFDKNLSYGFFSSNRPGGLGSDDIYAFRNYRKVGDATKKQVIAKEKSKKLIFNGYVKDKTTLLPLDKATVFLLNSITNEVLVLKTNKSGYYEFQADKGVLYVAKAMSQGYFDNCLNFRIPEEYDAESYAAPRDLLLDKYTINQIFTIKNIYYDLDKWNIRDDAKPALDNLVRILKKYPINVELGSHTDSRASAAYNIELSQKRAESVVRYLVLNGINPARLTAKGYGETKLVNKCADGVPCTEAEHQANRRTEFKITSINAEEKDKKSFDPDVFKAGDKIPVQLFEPDFFNNCLEADTPGINIQSTTDLESTQESHENKTSIWFSVQIIASVKRIRPIPENFKQEKLVQEKTIGKYYKYFTGHFFDLEEARSACKKLKSKFPDAFVVAFNGEKIIPIEEACQ